MNLWVFISTIILSIGLTSTPFYHLPTFELSADQSGSTVSVEEKVFNDASTVVPHKIFNQSLGVKISAQSAAVMDKDSNTILWQKNAGQVRSLASITKLMTALVFLEHNPGWQTVITMEPEDEAGGGIDHILQGEIVTVQDLFYTTLIPSDNNAAKALVRSTGFSQEEFVSLMNAKAKDLGLINTLFVEPTGLSQNNQSTALEVLELAKYAFADSNIADAVDRSTYSFQAKSGQNHQFSSTNQLLDSYLNVVAGKTGYIGDAGYCLVSEIVSEDGHHILAVVLGSDSHEGRFFDLKVMAGWVFNNFIWS